VAPQDTVAGFIGLGMMGSALSAHLLAAGWRVAGYDIDPARLAAHTGRGGEAASSPAGTATGAGVVVTSLPTAQALLDVATGGAGLVSVPGRSLVVIETSTLPLAVKRQARDALAERGIVLLDCPLSGTGGQALTKNVVAYLSGPQEAKARALPVLCAMTRAIHDVGDFGNGSAVKFIANLLVAIHNVAAAEALVLAERAGLDLAAVLTAVADGAGSSDMFEVRGPAMATADYSGPGVTTTVFAKDLEIIAGFAKDTATPTPLFTLASSFYAAALAQGHAGDDTASVHAVLRGLAGG
jgi:3-hydroxyisobutyrate dehydrogenase-like beta-hydroxyacid dehydrogenase